jgi:hypothetical protein
MTRQLILGGLLGGLTLYAWLSFSWIVLPFHRAALHKLPTKTYSSTTGDDLTGPAAAVIAMQQSGTLEHGIYYSGSPHKGSTGPAIPFMVWLPQGYPSMASFMARGLVFSLFAGLFVALIVLAVRQHNFKARVGICLCIGAVVAFAGPATNGNFFFFPVEWILPDVFDQLIGWTLAGLVIAAFTSPTVKSPTNC